MEQASFAPVVALVRAALERVFAEKDSCCTMEAPAGAFRPRAGGWSCAEILEHVALTNHYLLLSIDKSSKRALRKASSQAEGEDPGRYQERFGLIELTGRPTFVWHRPEHMQPSGKKPVEEVRRELSSQRVQCLKLLEQLPAGKGARHKVRLSVGDIGSADVYEYLYFLAVHAGRHLHQIERVRAEFAQAAP